MNNISERKNISADQARSNPTVANALGSPIKEGFLVSGNINVNGASGNAELAIPISGPKGKATIYVEAVKSAGEWSFSKLVVKLEQQNVQDKGEAFPLHLPLGPAGLSSRAFCAPSSKRTRMVGR
jgi:hypothetical protein